MEARTPAEILEFTVGVGAAKAERPVPAQLILAFMAGAFIAFAAQGSNMAAFNLLAKPETYGIGRALLAVVFGVGLMLVLIAGAELFTGNNLIIIGVLEKRVAVGKMLANWLFVYLGNLAGSLFIAALVNATGLFGSGAALLGGMTIKIAAGKTALGFGQAFVMGFLCNWLVCLAVWVSFAARDVVGKMLACFFIIGLFVVSGFEHSVANMYYIPAGILAKANETYFAAALNAGTGQAALDGLNWGSFFVKNLLPVTLGNLCGGLVMVGFLYWAALKKRRP